MFKVKRNRTLICAFNIFDKIKAKYSKRVVTPSPYCEVSCFYYYNVDGMVRKVDTKDGSIWACDYERGFPYMKRIR